MARDNAQDREIDKMDKINRQFPNDRKPVIKSLKEQLSDEAKRVAMSPEQQRAAMSWENWEYELREFVRNTKIVSVSMRTYDMLMARHKEEIHKFHEQGTNFKTIAMWMDDTGNQYSGWV